MLSLSFFLVCLSFFFVCLSIFLFFKSVCPCSYRPPDHTSSSQEETPHSPSTGAQHGLWERGDKETKRVNRAEKKQRPLMLFTHTYAFSHPCIGLESASDEKSKYLLAWNNQTWLFHYTVYKPFFNTILSSSKYLINDNQKLGLWPLDMMTHYCIFGVCMKSLKVKWKTWHFLHL